MRTILLCVNESQQGQRIDSFLASVLDDVSRTQAARLCDGGHVLLGGAQVQKRALVRAGDEVAVTLPDPVPLPHSRRRSRSTLSMRTNPLRSSINRKGWWSIPRRAIRTERWSTQFWPASATFRA